MEFTITSENNLSVLIEELEALWCNARDDNAHSNLEDIEFAIDALDQQFYDMKGEKNFLPFNIDQNGQIVGAQLPNFASDFIMIALENAVERLDWQA